MKKADIWVLIGIIVCSVLPLLFLFGGKSGNTVTVTVKKDDTVIYCGDIRENRVIAVPGTGNKVTVENGKVWMSEADCRDRLCMKEGYADKIHPIVCLPNKVTVTVTQGDSEYDAIAK